MARAPRPSFVRRLLELRLFLVVNVLILFFLALSFGKEFARNYTIQREINELQAQADELTARNFEIQELAQAIQTESFIEREARLKLGLSKPGEQVVVIESPDAPGEESNSETIAQVEGMIESTAAATPQTEEVANPAKWWYYFFDKSSFEAIRTYGDSP